jgi:hypothetical protein
MQGTTVYTGQSGGTRRHREGDTPNHSYFPASDSDQMTLFLGLLCIFFSTSWLTEGKQLKKAKMWKLPQILPKGHHP